MTFRLAVLALALCACELEPPPHQKPAPAPSAPTQVAPAPRPIENAPGARPAAPTTEGSAAPAPVMAKPDITESCLRVGVHFADVWVKTAKDAQERATLEQERALMVRRTSEACTKQAWKDDAQACFEKAATRADLLLCQKMVAPPVITPPPPVGVQPGEPGAGVRRPAPGVRHPAAHPQDPISRLRH